MTMPATAAPVVFLFRPRIRAHVPPPPDPQQPPGSIPPDNIPPGSPDREVDLPPREKPDEVREPITPPLEDPPVRTRQSNTFKTCKSGDSAVGVLNGVGGRGKV